MVKIFCFILFLTGVIICEIKPTDGLQKNPPSVWALTGGTVHIKPGTILEDATIIIRDGLIENVGSDIAIPKDATVLNMSGRTMKKE